MSQVPSNSGDAPTLPVAASSLLPIFDNMPAIVFLKDLDGRYLFVNRGFERRFRVDRANLIGKTDHDIFPQATADVFRANDLRVIETAQPLMTEELAKHADDGVVHTSIVVKFLVLNTNGVPEALCGVATDISERKQAEDLLKRSQAQLTEAQRIAHIGSWDWDLLTEKVVWSDELYRMTGADRFTYKPSYNGFLGLVHPEDLDRVRRIIGEALDRRSGFSVEYRLVRPDGTTRVFHSRGRVEVDERGQPIRMVGTGQDVTDRKAMETQLVVRDRLASTGVLAAGVAHEINNPLAYITANLEAMADELRDLAGVLPPAKLAEWGQMINDGREGARRVRKIVSGLQTFTRSDEAERVPLDLRQVIELSINMTYAEIRHRARLVKDLGPVPLVEVNEARLGQVLINLLVNAAQALPEGQTDRHEIRVVTRTDAAGRAVIEVRDTGSGIPREIRDRIFEPFFTTKPLGVGTGLGLSICHGIITALGGDIQVESEMGKGSVFRVSLPPAEDVGAPLAPQKLPPGTGHEEKPLPRAKILVIDDDELTLNALVRTLRREHEVVAMTSARQALARLQSKEEFDLVLCDLMMPDLGGMDLFAELERHNPARLDRLVFVTGGAFTASARAFFDRIPNERIEKPFDGHNLRQLVRRYVRER